MEGADVPKENFENWKLIPFNFSKQWYLADTICAGYYEFPSFALLYKGATLMYR